MDHYDILIIGSGAGGASFAQALAGTGKSILILERGEHIPVGSDNWDPKRVFVDRIYRTDEQWTDKNDKPFTPNTHYWVGGNTSFYGAALMRFKPLDFDQTDHVDGISPAWPITYDDMRPWYEKAERLWEVHGERGIDPTDDPKDPPYPFPALTHDPGMVRLKEHFESLGWTPSPLPLGVRRNDANPRAGKCVRCKTCGGFPCRLLAKVDARTAALEPLKAAPNVTLRPGYKVLALKTDASGKKVTEVVASGPDGEVSFSADHVALAAGAANSAALLLKSASPKHPKGLANSSDQVGRNYMYHTTSAVISVALSHFDSSFPKTLCVNDFYFGDTEEDFNFPMGQIQMLEYMSGQTLEGQLAEMINPDLVPDSFMDVLAERMVSFLVMSEDLPRPYNRVTLNDNGGIKLSYTEGDLTAHKRLVEKLETGLEGFTRERTSLFEVNFVLDRELPLYGTAHQCGTLRMGNDPATSVVDEWCKAHDLDNLYVVDASVFVSSAAVNPTLTIVANALRVGARLAEELTG